MKIRANRIVSSTLYGKRIISQFEWKTNILFSWIRVSEACMARDFCLLKLKRIYRIEYIISTNMPCINGQYRRFHMLVGFLSFIKIYRMTVISIFTSRHRHNSNAPFVCLQKAAEIKHFDVNKSDGIKLTRINWL